MRRSLKRWLPPPTTLHTKPWLRPFAHWLGDPRLWAPQRRTVARAFGAGIVIAFIPLPVHLPLAVFTALVARLHVPTIVATIFLVNPLTAVPVYYFAYRVGVAVTHFRPETFEFALTWDWLQHGLGPLWQPFLIGCAVSGVGLGLLGWLLLDRAWVLAVRRAYARRGQQTR
jgi:hypothetical protein